MAAAAEEAKASLENGPGALERALLAAWASGPLAGRLQAFVRAAARREAALCGAATLVLVHNELRKSAKRQAEPGHEHVLQPWRGGAAFHFGKVPPDEVVLAPAELPELRVLVNLFPVAEAHCLLASTGPVPQCFTSAASEAFLRAALALFLRDGVGALPRRWVLFFSSFGANASVNNLHAQLIPHPFAEDGHGDDHHGHASQGRERRRLYLEAVPLRCAHRRPWGRVLELDEAAAADGAREALAAGRPAPPPSLRVVVFDLDSAAGLRDMCGDLHALLDWLARADISHNFCTLRRGLGLDPGGDSTLRIAVIPRRVKSFATAGAGVEPAALELLGMLVVFDRATFESFDAAQYDALKSRVELDREPYRRLMHDELPALFGVGGTSLASDDDIA
jgi:hypothetical protein